MLPFSERMAVNLKRQSEQVSRRDVHAHLPIQHTEMVSPLTAPSTLSALPLSYSDNPGVNGVSYRGDQKSTIHVPWGRYSEDVPHLQTMLDR